MSTDGQNDKVIPLYPPFNFVEAGGITNHGRYGATDKANASLIAKDEDPKNDPDGIVCDRPHAWMNSCYESSHWGDHGSVFSSKHDTEYFDPFWEIYNFDFGNC